MFYIPTCSFDFAPIWIRLPCLPPQECLSPPGGFGLRLFHSSRSESHKTRRTPDRYEHDCSRVTAASNTRAENKSRPHDGSAGGRGLRGHNNKNSALAEAGALRKSICLHLHEKRSTTISFCKVPWGLKACPISPLFFSARNDRYSPTHPYEWTADPPHPWSAYSDASQGRTGPFVWVEDRQVQPVPGGVVTMELYLGACAEDGVRKHVVVDRVASFPCLQNKR